MLTIETLHTVDTVYSADSVEWCPSTGSTDYFLCGTYQLEENASAEQPNVPAKRKGQIHLYHYDKANDVLELKDTHETAAILDMKWCTETGTNNAGPIVAAANANGEVLLYHLKDGKIVKSADIHLNADDDNLLTLSIDWSPATESLSRQLLASDSKGNISLLQLSNVGLDMVSSWSGHSFEAWTCAFDKWNPSIVYSGGDDMALRVYDVRMESKNVLTNRSHNAGVTTLYSFGDMEHLLATGSYDEELRLFDTRHLKTELCSVNLGGGIWRIRQNARRNDWLLCANMYHNFSIVKMVADGGRREMNVVAEYFEHSSICYGADWRIAENNDDIGSLKEIIGTCSFYDHKLCVSKVVENVES